MTTPVNMRAVAVRDGHLVVEHRPVPEPGAGEVLVKTLACGICGSDLHLFKHGRASPWITATVPLERVAEAFALLQGSDLHAKILITPSL